MTLSGVFVSDLHLFSRRSIGQERWNQWQSVLDDQDLLVLGGDIFDFRWSNHALLADSIAAAELWLCELQDRHPRLRTIFIMGNHDCLPQMQSALQLVTNLSTRFGWTDNYIKFGNKIFLHGDIIDAGGFGDPLKKYRSQFQEHQPRGKVANRIYDAVVAARIHRLPARWMHQPARVTAQMSQHLAANLLGSQQGVNEVFFGHTHAPIEGQAHRDQVFFNSGSGIKHLGFHPIPFRIEAQDLDKALESQFRT